VRRNHRGIVGVLLGSLVASVVGVAAASGVQAQAAPTGCTGRGTCAPGGEAFLQFTSTGSGCTFSVTVDWGDGSAPESFTYGTPDSVKRPHLYAGRGLFTAKISGTAAGNNCTFTNGQVVFEVPEPSTSVVPSSSAPAVVAPSSAPHRPRAGFGPRGCSSP
jgi:hypothetical protein